MNFRSALAIVLFLISHCCYSQDSNNIIPKKSVVNRKEFNDSIRSFHISLKTIQIKLDSVHQENLKLTHLHDTLIKYVDDRRLRESLTAAASTINMQNSWLTGFGTIYTYITVIIGIIALAITIIQIIYYLSSIRPALNDAREANRDARVAIDTLRDRILEFDQRIEEKFDFRFEEYSKQLKAQKIDQIISDLTVANAFLRDQACFRLNTYKRIDLSTYQVHQVISLFRQRLDKPVEEALIYFLTREEN